jgi:hypothetical protein
MIESSDSSEEESSGGLGIGDPGGEPELKAVLGGDWVGEFGGLRGGIKAERIEEGRNWGERPPSKQVKLKSLKKTIY